MRKLMILLAAAAAVACVKVNNRRAEPETLTETHPWVDLGVRLDGEKILFATANLGATRPEEFGDFFTWADPGLRYSSIEEGIYVKDWSFTWENYIWCSGDKPEGSLTKYTAGADGMSSAGKGDGLTSMEEADDAAAALWGDGWKVPTIAQWKALVDADVDIAWVDDYEGTGVKGGLFTGKGEYAGESLFLPATGCCNQRYRWLDGEFGRYWAREIKTEKPDLARCLAVYPDQITTESESISVALRFMGQPIRAIYTEPAN